MHKKRFYLAIPAKLLAAASFFLFITIPATAITFSERCAQVKGEYTQRQVGEHLRHVCLCLDSTVINPFTQSCTPQDRDDEKASQSLESSVSIISKTLLTTPALLAPSPASCSDTGDNKAATEDKKTWSEQIWKIRNNRELSLPDPDKYFVSLWKKLWKVKYQETLSETASVYYNMQYSYEDKKLIISSTFKDTSTIPPFRIQYEMLMKIAKKSQKDMEIHEIVRESIINPVALESLSIDFPSPPIPGQSERKNKIREMQFFTSPNGRNTLDLIKKIDPHSDPFSLIQKVILEYKSDDESPNVIIHLKKPIKIDPHTTPHD